MRGQRLKACLSNNLREREKERKEEIVNELIKYEEIIGISVQQNKRTKENGHHISPFLSLTL